jgi:hypothetical protein
MGCGVVCSVVLGRKEQRGVVPPYGIGEADWFTQTDRRDSTLFLLRDTAGPRDQ